MGTYCTFHGNKGKPPQNSNLETVKYEANFVPTRRLKMAKKTKNKTFILSDDTVNSYGFRIDIENSDLERFQTNPVMFYNHWDFIGSWENIRIEDGKLLAEPVFMDDENETTALKVSKRVENGFLKAASLGINILKWEETEGEPPIATVEVFECSIVDIPSNANAVTLYDTNGQKLEGEAISLALNAIKTNSTQEKTEKKTDMKLNAKSLTVLGLTEKSSDDSINEAIDNLAKQNAQLSADNDKLKADSEAQKQKAIDALISTALNDGRITADKKEKFEKLAATDLELATDTINALPAKKTLSGKEDLENPKTELGDRESWTFADWRKKDTAGLLALKKENPEKYQEIINK